ncbi:MAG: hypothetical protein WAM60_24715 [Candidatus Promineifilaceae bacterium]
MPTNLSLDSNIPARWLPIVRATWSFFALLLIIGFILGVPSFHEELRQPCSADSCPPYTVSMAEANLLEEWGLSLGFYAFYLSGTEIFLAFVFTLPAFLIFWRKSADWIGILASLAFLFIGFVVMTEEMRALTREYPALFPFSEILTSIGVLLFMMVFYLFPDGRFAPRWLGYFVALSSIVILLPPFLPGDGPRSASGNMIVTVVGLSNVVVGFVSQLYRYRRVSTPTQRQQTKWVVLGFIGFFSAVMFWTVLAEFSTLPPGWPRLLFGFTALLQAMALGLFPFSVVIAMMRYRLWDIDLIIRRTLVYSVLTGTLVLVYFGSVVVVQTAVNGLTGREQSSQLTIALSTLLIAALFSPLRRRVQAFIDRRFYRRNYNAAQTLTQFAETARDEVDMDQLSAVLVTIVEETMQPEEISLWLKPDSP